MATTKSAGATKLGRDSNPKYLGVKVYGGQSVKLGDIIIRQRGTKFIPGINVGIGNDDTIYALKKGIVRFQTIRKRGFNKSQRISKVVHVK